MSNTRIELEEFGDGKNIDSTALDHRFLDAAFCCSINVRSARTSDSPSNVVNVSQLVYQALFIFVAQRLPPPFTIRVKFPGLDHVIQIEWKQGPWATRTVCLATRSVAPPMLETGLRYHAEDFEGHTAVTVLTAFATDVSKAAEEDARPGQIVPLQAGRYAYLLLFACLHTFHDRILLPQLAEHLLSLYSKPAHALDVGIFEHLLLPHFPSSVVKQGQELVGKIRNQDSTVPAPQPRSRGCPLRLHVGDTFLHRRTGELGLVVGWELKPGKRTLVTPRSKRGAQGGAIPKPTPLRLAPQLDEYLYLAVMESATRYSSPTKVNPLDVDATSSPTT
ncbi:hypothetical protein BCR35DRAFT_356515 [Leucosporidium creatinivorum]|uniref:Uncharacterized protein n=1 Tax=Leucosporidium creatinivorum TaxID=106004 RepID=A0A1Y2BUF6_9BASI|nr:hypothetical protein BCR35DRAFT_356515 [Leucosporidium creatinivorum]